MAGLAYLETLSYIDTDRMAAAGASFGGYMMNFFEGHTDKFKTLITHCGVYNFDSMYATTDELWFDEWEHGGPPWGKRHCVREALAPPLCPELQDPDADHSQRSRLSRADQRGVSTVHDLAALGVPSKLINFPDEGHWVLKPPKQHLLAPASFRLAEGVCEAGPELRHNDD